MVRVCLAEWGSQLLGREAGARVHDVVVDALSEAGSQGVVIDCTGVTDMTMSFADELFGRLSDRPREADGGSVRVEGLDPTLHRVVRFAISQSRREPVA